MDRILFSWEAIEKQTKQILKKTVLILRLFWGHFQACSILQGASRRLHLNLPCTMFHHQTPGGSVILLPTHHSSLLPCDHSVHTSDLPREWRVYLPFERGFSLGFSYLVSFCLAGLPLFSHQVRSLLCRSYITRNQGTHPSLWLSCPLVSVISSIQRFGESPNLLGTAVETHWKCVTDRHPLLCSGVSMKIWYEHHQKKTWSRGMGDGPFWRNLTKQQIYHISEQVGYETAVKLLLAFPLREVPQV